MSEKESRPALPPLALRLARAARLRCPFCGGGPLLESWFRLRPRCPVCHVHTARAEDDLTLGGMMFNLVIAEGFLVLLLVGVMIATWPDVPWNLVQFGGVAMMVAAPFLLFPFSKATWMAFDLMLHPPTHEELAGGPLPGSKRAA